MGLSSKHVSGDHQAGFEWAGLQSGAAEVSKPPPIRRQAAAHQQSEPLNCPRCNSANTKFCYYNNYNKSQPRHFCKSCKRHWTKGGTLRNVPVGGGRKNKRPKISKATVATPAAAPRQQDLAEFPLSGGGAQRSMPNIIYQALLHETTKGLINTASSAGLNASSSPNNPTSEFQFSSLSTLDMNVSWNPSSYQPLNAFDHYAANLDSIEESTVTTVNNIPSSSTLDLPNYWNWGDIDVLNSGDLNMSWDEDVDNAEIKPQTKIQD